MHPRILELLDHLSTTHRLLLAAVEDVPVVLRDRRPVPERWSVAEVLQHLAIVDGRIAANLTKRVAAARSDGIGPDREASAILPTIDLSRLRDRTTKVAAPPPILPLETLDEATARQRLERAHAALCQAVRASDGVDLGLLSTPHPLFGEMHLYQWIAFAGGHEVRHAAQITEIGDALNANAGRP